MSVLEPLLFLNYVNYKTKDVIVPCAADVGDFKLSVNYPRHEIKERLEEVHKLQAQRPTLVAADVFRNTNACNGGNVRNLGIKKN